jgi:hypothetical protein
LSGFAGVEGEGEPDIVNVLGHRHATGMKHLRRRHPQDPDVKPQGPMLHVPDVKFEPLSEAQGVASLDNRPTRHSGAHLMTASLARTVCFEVFHQQGPWPDETHLAADDVPEFGQLVQAGLAEESPRSGHAGFVCSVWVFAGPRFAHGPKLDDVERDARQTWTTLMEKDRPALGHKDSDCHDTHHGRQ